MADALLEVDGIETCYGRSQVLFGLSLSIAPGELVTLMGRNGMGKTTLLKCIMGLLPIASGAMSYGLGAENADLSKLAADRRARLGIAYVPQGREIFSQLTVEENLRIGFGARRGKKIAQVPEHIFEWFPVLKKMLRRRGGDLSGGQQQQLAIGRAMVLDPKLLILDEPAEGIQPNIVHEIGDIIMRLNREAKLTVLLVEQKLPFARRVASEFRLIDKGRIVGGGEIAALTDDLVHEHLTV
jgi:urea transport system ATP-binding protein